MRGEHSSVASVQIGNNEYPVKHEPQCAVCTSPYRLDIERAIVAGYSYKKIRDSLPDEPDVDIPQVRSMQAHVQQMHLPLPQVQRRAIIESRAKEIGESIEEGQGLLVDYIGVNQLLIQEGLEALQKGEIQMKAGDLIGALKFQHEIEQTTGGSLDDEAWSEALMEYMRITQKLMPPEMWNKFANELQSSDIIRALARKMNGEGDDDPHVEVREIED